ncbi:unnamed protein product [Allacma fusca]|uniref:Uncharacterized protein n=1 Tax=Allacma fusca TaxID=39272 RepID=A0A8J2JQD3_9HEXA|nr:unnamed protein product [Allacma fusca]
MAGWIFREEIIFFTNEFFDLMRSLEKSLQTEVTTVAIPRSVLLCRTLLEAVFHYLQHLLRILAEIIKTFNSIQQK